MNKPEVYEFLNQKNIPYRAYEHEAVFTVEAANALNLPDPECSLNIKELQAMIGSRKLQFASEDDLYKYTKLIRGSVTPLGTLNDEGCFVQVYIDAYYMGRQISIHPNENTATIYLNCDDLMQVIHEHGNTAEYLSFE